MNLPLYIARRIYGTGDDKRKVSPPAIKIATIGVAIGLAVMIVTVSVVLGFKHTIRDKVVGFGSHIRVQNAMATSLVSDHYVCLDDTMMQALTTVEGIRHAARFVMTQGILKTDEDFLGVTFKGVGPDYDVSFLEECIVEGALPAFSDSTTSYPLVLSKTMADKLRLNTGDKIYAYFIRDDDVRARRFTVSAIYQTNMKRFDDLVCITDLCVTQKLNAWSSDQCTGAELLVSDFAALQQTYRQVVNRLRDTTDAQGNRLAPQTIVDAYPQVFSWLDLLDINVWIILALMIAVAGFTMVSGLLIIILERTQMIGLLKALGARNKAIRATFLWFAAFIIGRGLLWGNLAGVACVLIQQYTGVIRLDPQTYYVSQAPMEFNFPIILLLNLATLLISIFVLIAPSYLASSVHPAQSMRYE